MTNILFTESVVGRSSANMDMRSKVVLVTGASSGIGAACAVKFARAGAQLALVGRNEENLKKVADQCQQTGGNQLLHIIADISIDLDVERIVNDTIRHYSRIDVLINNAGIYQTSEIEDGIEIFDRVMATNVRGTYLLTSRVIPHLITTKGNIVNISSMLSTKPRATLSSYCMSKAALDMFTRASAVELGPKGVRVNSVNPGPVDTELFKRSGLTSAGNEQMFQLFRSVSPLRKVTDCENVANFVLFLSSDSAASVTGQCHVVDAGLSLGN